MKHFCVYAICCPITKNVVYVGKTSDFKIRQRTHIYCNKPYPITIYIQGLLKIGLRPVFNILEDFGFFDCQSDVAYKTHTEVCIAEDKWILYYRQLNFLLFNIRKTYTK